MSRAIRVAVFRPDDDRLRDATAVLSDLGARPVPDPMLEIRPTGATPGAGDYVVFTSKTGVELATESGWTPDPDKTLVAIGPRTAEAAESAGWRVDLIPTDYTSEGLVELLAARVEGAAVEVARSDHGSQVLLDGLRDAGADVTETVLYRLVRPPESGDSATMAARGDLEAVAFTSSLTVEHFLEAARERDVEAEAIAGLTEAVVGAIGPPTRETAESLGIEVDVVPDDAEFEALATAVVEAASSASVE